MKNFKKRGQAAMEFLMTYGWAILAAVIVIGALGTYFYFNQGAQTSVFVNAPFYATAAQVNAGQIVVELENKGQEDLTNVDINVTGYGCTADNSTFDGTAVGPQVITLNCSGVTSGTKVSGDLIITYRRPGSSLDLTSTGSVSGKAA